MRWFLTLIMFNFCKTRPTKNVAYANNIFMEERILDGQTASISNHPHAAFIAVHCKLKERKNNKTEIHILCGSSIVNQHFLLTAAHCLNPCHRENSYIDIAAGTESFKIITHVSDSFQAHGDHKDHPPINDVGLVKTVYPLTFGKNLKRAIFMQHPPHVEVGDVAGWGVTDPLNKIFSSWLMETPQRIAHRDECLRDLPKMPVEAFCAKQIVGNGYPGSGDSGSGLIVNNSIIIGVVSYHKSSVNGTEVYANVSHFYDWIMDTMQLLHCEPWL